MLTIIVLSQMDINMFIKVFALTLGVKSQVLKATLTGAKRKNQN